VSINLYATPRIAVLEFELKDLTLKPGVPAEIERYSFHQTITRR
jgi:hypothetical protein